MTDLIDLIETTEPDQWISTLQNFQKDSIKQLSAQGNTYDAIAELWITATIPATAPFSAEGGPNVNSTYFEKLKEEFRAFICGHKKYEKEREEISTGQKSVHTYVVSTMSVAIAPHVGSVAVVIVPVLVLMLASLGKISINAWCANT